MHYSDSLDHLDSDVEDGLEIEFASALLEQIFQTLSQHVHDHDVVHLSILGLLVTNEVKIWDGGFASQFMDQLTLPEKHNVLLVLDGLLNLGGKEVSSLLLFDLVDLSEGSSSEPLDDLVSFVENLLSLFHELVNI